jgi:hypothetical protein
MKAEIFGFLRNLTHVRTERRRAQKCIHRNLLVAGLEPLFADASIVELSSAALLCIEFVPCERAELKDRNL